MKCKIITVLLVVTLLLSVTCLTAYASEYSITVRSGKALSSSGATLTAAEPGTEVTLVADNAPQGMKFDCWVRYSGMLEIDTKAAVCTFIMPSRNVELEASYTSESGSNPPAVTTDPNLKVKVSFRPGEGTGEMDDQNIPVNTAFSIPQCGFSAPSGKTFSGWLFNDRVYPAGSAFTPTESNVNTGITFTAVWSVLPSGSAYTLAFDMGGHGTQIASQALAEGEKPFQPADPTTDGLSFGGWYSDAACTIPFVFSRTLTANTVAYALWVDPAVSPPTGDSNNVTVWILLAAVASACMGGMLTLTKRKNQ